MWPLLFIHFACASSSTVTPAIKVICSFVWIYCSIRKKTPPPPPKKKHESLTLSFVFAIMLLKAVMICCAEIHPRVQRCTKFRKSLTGFSHLQTREERTRLMPQLKMWNQHIMASETQSSLMISCCCPSLQRCNQDRSLMTFLSPALSLSLYCISLSPCGFTEESYLSVACFLLYTHQHTNTLTQNRTSR